MEQEYEQENENEFNEYLMKLKIIRLKVKETADIIHDKISGFSNDKIKNIHYMVYNELKTRYKIKKFIRRLDNYFHLYYQYENIVPSIGLINEKINELIEYLDKGYNIKFNRDINDFYLSDIEYDIFYYFIVNKFNYKLIDCKVK